MSDTSSLEPSSSGPGLSFDQEPRPSSVSTATAIMESRDVALGFGVATIMEDITVSFPKGTITALVGPSGSGKTTFLRSLNRMNDKVRGF